MEQATFATTCFSQAKGFFVSRWYAWPVVVLLFGIPAVPTSVEALGDFLSCHECKYDIVFLACPGPVMKNTPTFSANPPGFASYPFEEQCPVRLQEGQYHNGVIHLYFEGRWNPSETRQDRPNAVETLFIENYEQFFPHRQMTGPGERRIFVYWTARCTTDPWLRGGVCQRLGEYVPSDVREAFPRIIEDKPFPLTGNSMSPKLKQQLIKQYQAANQSFGARTQRPKNTQSMMASPQSEIVMQSQGTQAMAVQPQPALPGTQASAGALARSGLFSRAVEEKEAQTMGQEGNEVPTGAAAETSDPAIIKDGTPDIAEPVALKLEQPFHATDAKGAAVELQAGTYEIGTILDLQLGVAQAGQRTVLLNANRDTHTIPIHKTIAVVIPGPSDDLHLLFLTADGRRFDAIGFPSAVKPRSIDKIPALPDKTIEAAVRAASVSPRGVSSPPCRPNPDDIGPRWVPVPCTVTDP